MEGFRHQERKKGIIEKPPQRKKEKRKNWVKERKKEMNYLFCKRERENKTMNYSSRIVKKERMMYFIMKEESGEIKDIYVAMKEERKQQKKRMKWLWRRDGRARKLKRFCMWAVTTQNKKRNKVSINDGE